MHHINLHFTYLLTKQKTPEDNTFKKPSSNLKHFHSKQIIFGLYNLDWLQK